MVVQNQRDKRHFMRCSRDAGCKITVRGRECKAKTVDYSLGGLGAIVHDCPQVEVGDQVQVNVPGTSINFSGLVVRMSSSNSKIKLGIMRTGQINGSLTDFRLADVLLGLQRGGRTGILDIAEGEIWKCVFINSGDMVFASSNRDEDRMGDQLLALGKITREQYDKSSEVMKREKLRHGAALVKMGYLKPQDLPWAVQHHVEEILLSLFALSSGRFEFKESPLPKDEVITLKLSAANLIYRGIKKVMDIHNLWGDCPPGDAILTFSSNPLDLFQDLKIDEEDKRILSYVDGRTPIKTILQLVRRDEDDAMRAIYALISTRLITAKDTPTKQDVTAEEVMEEKRPEPSAEIIAEVQKMFEEYERLGYYGVLSVKTSAPAEEVRRAYYRMAKKFHPDKHFLLPAEMKHKLNVLFSYITTAYSTLTNPARRKEYDDSLTVRAEKLGSNVDIAISKYKAGMSELKQGRFEEAARLFAEASYLDGSIAKYHFHYGVAMGKTGNAREAEKAISRALKSDPYNPEYLAEAGHAYIALGLPTRARANFERALKAEPANARAKEGLAKLEVQ